MYSVLLTTGCKKDDTNIVTDIEGNIYKTVTIGTQVWMAENLKTTRYNDNKVIINLTYNAAWSSQKGGAYCWYNNNIYNKARYGALYNYCAIVDSSNLCPTGWHVPTDEEWTYLITYLGGFSEAGGKLKSANWPEDGPYANNSSGFTALPGGYRDISGSFFNFSFVGFWWSFTECDPKTAMCYILSYGYSDILSNRSSKELGLSVRCIKN